MPAVNDNIRAFIRELAQLCWEGGSLDGGDLQDMLVKHGMLTPVTMAKPCEPDCFCGSEYGLDAFPLTCYKLTKEYL